MPSVCPFCNSVLSPLPSPPLSEKLPCPRCGEPVAAGTWQIDASRPLPSSAAIAPQSQAPGKRKTLFAVLGIMLLMAIIGLSYALWTQSLRRSRDPKGQETIQPISFRRPLELAGLGYLPPGCQIVVGLQIAELLEDKAGKKLLGAPRPAVLDWILKQIPRTTGLNLEDLDHILAAVSFDAQFPQLVLVVKTRPKVSLEKIAAAQPITSTLYQDRALYEFSLKPYGEALVWCVEDHTLLYVIRTDTPKVENLRGLSVKERPVRDLLLAPLHETLEKRLAKHQLLWAVGRLDQLGPLKDLLPLFLGAKANLGPLLDVETFGLAVESSPLSEDELTLTGQFQFADGKQGARFKTLLEGVKIDGATSQKVEAPPADEPQPWLTWQVRGDVAAMRRFLNQDVPGKK